MAIYLWLTDVVKIFMENESDYFGYVLSKTSSNSAGLALSSYNKWWGIDAKVISKWLYNANDF